MHCHFATDDNIATRNIADVPSTYDKNSVNVGPDTLEWAGYMMGFATHF